MALESMRRADASDPIRERIAAQEKAERDAASGLQAARQEGLAEGEARGEARGEAKGRAEAQREFARRMLAAGMDAETILNLTGLSIEEVGPLEE